MTLALKAPPNTYDLESLISKSFYLYHICWPKKWGDREEESLKIHPPHLFVL